MNAANSKLKVFSVGLPVNTKTGEGMAVLSEYFSGNFNMSSLSELALRVLVVDAMYVCADFKGCFDLLKNNYKKKEDSSYDLCVRVYRGGGFYNTIVEIIERNIVENPQYITQCFKNPQTEMNNQLFDYILSGLK